MTEQEKKDAIRLIRHVYCDDCPFQYDRYKCIHEFETREEDSELYCHKLADKLDREIVPFG